MKSLENTCHIPERFCGGDSLRRGAISTVCTFTFTFITRLSPPRKSGAPSRQIKWRLGATYTDQNLGHLTRSYAVDWTLLKTSACAGRVLRVSYTAHRTAEAIWNGVCLNTADHYRSSNPNPTPYSNPNPNLNRSSAVFRQTVGMIWQSENNSS